MLNEILINSVIECIVHVNEFEQVGNINDDDLSINNQIKKLQRNDESIRVIIDKVKSKKIEGYILEDEAY